MKWHVYVQSMILGKWRYCGSFEAFTKANEHIDYLERDLPCGDRARFRVSNTLDSL